MYFTIHTLDGNPDELLAAKREHFDPVVAEHAPRFGAISTVTLRTDTGLTVYNLWLDADGARSFTALPEIQNAQRVSRLPAPSSFVRHDDADGTDFSAVP
ncbi:hypothetical protein [Leifsonia sp. EB34]|uniref:hypothetical protein n=1 Tax=Leifsonia sp. EB34 TaxID=3156303 RepID=UPI003519B75D